MRQLTETEHGTPVHLKAIPEWQVTIIRENRLKTVEIKDFSVNFLIHSRKNISDPAVSAAVDVHGFVPVTSVFPMS